MEPLAMNPMEKNLRKLEAFLSQYLCFEYEKLPLVLSLWIICTHFFESFDAFPYIVITSNTKRAGKTRLSEVMSFASHRPMNFSAMTPSTLFRVVDPIDEKERRENKPPTISFDEAESLSSEGASTMRSVLNAGYRKGQTVPRSIGHRVVEFKVYCPKIFILIGDVYDTLRDRSIVVQMKRAARETDLKRFLHEDAKAEGKLIADDILRGLTPAFRSSVDGFYRTNRYKFLSDRDEEIWSSLFAVCHAVAPNRVRELQRIAVDLCALKTAEKAVHTNLNMFEEHAQQIEFAEKALCDLLAVINGDKAIFGEEAVKRMRDIDTAPWRTFRGGGLEQINLADLLSGFGVRPRPVRIGKQVLRGYHKKDVEKAVRELKTVPIR